MVRKSAAVGLVAALLSGGCGTVVNHSPYFSGVYSDKLYRPYGGVQYDAEAFAELAGPLVRGESATPARDALRVVEVGAFCLVDIPLSAVADTLLMRHTLRMREENRNRLGAPARPPESGVTVDTPSHPETPDPRTGHENAPPARPPPDGPARPGGV